MAKNLKKIAHALGADIVGQIPDVGGGAFGAARLAKILQARLQPSGGQRPGRPTDPSWVFHPKVPMSKQTMQKLTELAEQVSTPERKASPMQVAAQILENALEKHSGEKGVAVAKKIRDSSPPLRRIRDSGLREYILSELTSTGGRPGRRDAALRQKISLTEDEWEKLKGLAQRLRDSGVRVTPGQVAGVLLHQSLKDLEVAEATADPHLVVERRRWGRKPTPFRPVPQREEAALAASAEESDEEESHDPDASGRTSE